MRCFVSFISVVCFLSVLILVSSAPAPQSGLSASLQIGGGIAPSSGTSSSSGVSGSPLGGLSNILSQIDLPGLLRGVNSFVKLVGVFCPPLSQVLDNVIQNVTSTAFRVFGRLILQSGGLGGNSGGGSSGGGGDQRVSVVLPTFPPDDEDYEDDESSDSSNNNIESRIGGPSDSSNSTDSNSTAVPVALSRSDDSSTTTESTTIITSTTRSAALFTSPATSDDDNVIAKRHARVVREAEAEEEEEDEDQEGAESAPHPGEDPTNVDDDQDRNKRFLPFGGHVEGHGGGGSGNFLFDVIRNTADRAARTVGTVYRMVAGTESLGWGSWGTPSTPKSTSTDTVVAAQSAPLFQLVAGSGATEDHDEKESSPGGAVEIDVQKSTGDHGEGIPGPITRLFVIANRGVANLVQDLILRLAQTSERLVNFKARLITSLI